MNASRWKFTAPSSTSGLMYLVVPTYRNKRYITECLKTLCVSCGGSNFEVGVTKVCAWLNNWQFFTDWQDGIRDMSLKWCCDYSMVTTSPHTWQHYHSKKHPIRGINLICSAYIPMLWYGWWKIMKLKVLSLYQDASIKNGTPSILCYP